MTGDTEVEGQNTVFGFGSHSSKKAGQGGSKDLRCNPNSGDQRGSEMNFPDFKDAKLQHQDEAPPRMMATVRMENPVI